jgi:hypothetical protein
MDRSVPSGYIQTHIAIQEFVLEDKGYQRRGSLLTRRKNLNDFTKKRIQVSKHDRLNRLYLQVKAAIIKGDLRPKAWVAPHRQWYELPSRYWEAASIESLWTGVVNEKAKAISQSDRSALRDAPLCFKRDEWEAWTAKTQLSATLARGATPVTVGHAAVASSQQPAGNRPFNDGQLAAEVAASVRRGEFSSYRAAATARADEIAGYGMPDSKIRRIAEKARNVGRSKANAL